MNFIKGVVLSIVMFGIGNLVSPNHVQIDDLGNLIMASSLFITMGYLIVMSGILSVVFQKKVTRGRIKLALMLMLTWIPIVLYAMSTLMAGFTINGILTYIVLTIGGYYIFYIKS